MSGHKRRNFFIKKAFQARLLLGYFFFVISGGLFFIILMGLFTTDSMTISYSNNVEIVHTPMALLKLSIANHWGYLLLGSLFLVLVAIFATHRVAGPLYRFEQTLDNMLSGNLEDNISLRSKDEGKELASKINTFNSELSTSINKITLESSAIKDLLEEAHKKAGLLPEGTREEFQSLLWSIDEKNKKIALAGKHYCSRN